MAQMLKRSFTRSCFECCPLGLRIGIDDATQRLEPVSKLDLKRRTSHSLELGDMVRHNLDYMVGE